MVVKIRKNFSSLGSSLQELSSGRWSFSDCELIHWQQVNQQISLMARILWCRAAQPLSDAAPSWSDEGIALLWWRRVGPLLQGWWHSVGVCCNRDPAVDGVWHVQKVRQLGSHVTAQSSSSLACLRSTVLPSFLFFHLFSLGTEYTFLW